MLPKPPTDNLYKFLAVSGLVLVAVAIVVPLQRYDAYEQLVLEAIPASTAAADASMRRLDAAIEEATAREEGRPSRITTEQRQSIEATAEEASRKRDEVAFRLHAAGNRYSRWLVTAVVIGGLGLAMSVFGFWRWYSRLQRYQDILVEREARSQEH